MKSSIARVFSVLIILVSNVAFAGSASSSKQQPGPMLKLRLMGARLPVGGSGRAPQRFLRSASPRMAAAVATVYTNMDRPGSSSTTVRGINNTLDVAGACCASTLMTGYRTQNGVFAPVAAPSLLATQYSEVYKLKSNGDAVGITWGANGLARSFLLKADGTLTMIDYPAASETYALGMNNMGTVVGYWTLVDAGGAFVIAHGFTWNNGTFTSLDKPGAADTYPLGINNMGTIVGIFDTSATDTTTKQGFVLTSGSYATLAVPFAGAVYTQPNDINQMGQIVGDYELSDGTHAGFTYTAGTFTSLAYPGADFTTVWAVSTNGDIAGSYWAGGTAHGFRTK